MALLQELLLLLVVSIEMGMVIDLKIFVSLLLGVVGVGNGRCINDAVTEKSI